jgi:hypothetical protein
MLYNQLSHGCVKPSQTCIVNAGMSLALRASLATPRDTTDNARAAGGARYDQLLAHNASSFAFHCCER